MCVGSAGKGEKRLRLRGGDTHARMRKPSLNDYTRVGYPAPRSRQRGRPARQESAHGFNPKRRRACLCGGDPEEAGTSIAIAGRGGNDEGAKQDAL